MTRRDPDGPAETGRAFRLPWRNSAEIDTDLDEELRFHLDQRIAELTASGLPPAAAREEALRRFGNLDDARAYCRAQDRGRAQSVRRRDWLAGWAQDLGFAARQLRRTPGFTLVAVLTLALGIGANTAIFSVVHRLLLDPLPYPNGDRLVALMEVVGDAQIQISPWTESVAAWKAGAHTLEGIDQFGEQEVTLSDGATSELLDAGTITATLPAFLGISPALGRGFLPEETRPGGPAVTMLSYGLWQRRFGGRPEVLGATITLDGTPRTIVGVIPRDFALPFMGGAGTHQIWLPLLPEPEGGHTQAIGRLQPGVTPAAATAELTAITRSLTAQDSSRAGFTARALTPKDLMSDSLRKTLLLLFVVVGVVLLIACANVANLLLARASARHRELAIRAALGAGRGRIVRQLLTESVALALLGGVAGLVFAWCGLHLLIALRPDSLNELDEVRLEPVALAWSFGLSLLTGLAFGLAPALFATDRTLTGALKSTPGGAGGQRSSRRWRGVLVTAEVALSVILLVGAGLLIRTILRMQGTDPGFAPHNLAVVSLSEVPGVRLSGAEREAITRTLLGQIQALPGVIAAERAENAPPQGGAAFGQLEVEGRALGKDEQATLFGMVGVAPGYFRVLAQPVLQGTTFGPDTSGNTMIINATMAARYWPGTAAVGKRFRLDPKSPWITIAGVVADVRLPARRLDIDDLKLYAHFSTTYGVGLLVVRTAGDQAAVLGAIRRTVESTSSRIRLRRLETMDERMSAVLAAPRFSMSLFVAFAALALVLATVGLYGVISYSVGQRTREIGVRIALGADGGSVIGLVVRQGLGLTLAGVVIGLGIAALGTRAMESMLFEVDRLDPLTFGAVALLLLLVTLLAAFVPARRAASVDPVVALRSE